VFRLFCGKSPRRLGIEAADGSRDMIAFREHVESCPQCKCGAGKIMGMIASGSSPKKAAARGTERSIWLRDMATENDRIAAYEEVHRG
jgi:hypothetical protein